MSALEVVLVAADGAAVLVASVPATRYVNDQRHKRRHRRALENIRVMELALKWESNSRATAFMDIWFPRVIRDEQANLSDLIASSEDTPHGQ